MVHQGGDPALNLLISMSRDIGSLQEANRSIMTAVERLRIELHKRSDRIEQRLWHLQQPPPIRSTTGTSGRLAGLAALMEQVVLALKLALPLAFLAAVVAYKGLNPDWMPLLRQLLASL